MTAKPCPRSPGWWQREPGPPGFQTTLTKPHLPTPMSPAQRQSRCQNSMRISFRASPDDNLRKYGIYLTSVESGDRPDSNLSRSIAWNSCLRPHLKDVPFLSFALVGGWRQGERPGVWEQALWRQGARSFLTRGGLRWAPRPGSRGVPERGTKPIAFPSCVSY